MAELLYNQGTCAHCGHPQRRMFREAAGSGKKNTKQQRTRWFVCKRGHQTFRKRG